MVSRTAARLTANTPAIATAHFRAEADPYDPATNPGGYVNLGTAESRLTWDLLAPRLTHALSSSDVHYGPLHGTDGLRTAIAALLAGTWRRPVDPDDLVVVSGATAALDIAATALCDPGEVIVVPAPYYSAFEVDLAGRSGARLVPAPMSDTLDPSVVDDVLTRLRRDGATVRAVAITSPSNPQGHVYGAPVLRELLRVARRHDVDVIADEIYTHSVFSPSPFVSVRDPMLGGADRAHVIWGFAKDFGLSGLKVGVLHTTDPQVRAAARALAYFAPTSTDTQALLRDLLADTAWVRGFLAESAARLAASHRATAGLLDSSGIRYQAPAAGFSFWIDLRDRLTRTDFAAEHELYERILDRARVNILPGGAFAAPEPGWFRLCHAVDAALVHEGITRLAAVLTPAGRHG
ncbi:MAG TPA: aminotransferase class I/II-fold pyridoxal phosphate-dependent enzyme [Actinophytocola sp.]|uniref:aminotransferase class I/II-fold pyridoxal phosphate-dependent enzyme n=1 Tax=Actinophytocola sp. TaxID=1872138 RepID=UPI002E0CE2CA|nr:aminotransferase class I/II-fold pyridoxal phosphate-dependent enzyme [Actinophytocola sp.]